MKLEVTKRELVNAVSIVSRAVPVRTTLPVLSCILVNAEPETITLTANDMEIGVRTTVSGTVSEPGTVALNAKLFAEIVKKLPEGNVRVETENGSFETVVSCGKSIYRITSMDPDGFPDFPEVDGDYVATVPQKSLKDMIRQTAFSIAVENTNKMMTGELVEIKDGVLSLTSLEGHRISMRSTLLDKNAEDRKAIVPGKTMTELMKLLKDEGTVDVRFGKSVALFSFDGVSMTTRLIEGNYFKISQMIPNEYKTVVAVDRAEMSDTLERVLPLISAMDRVPVIVTITDGKMSVKLQSGYGLFEDEIPAETKGENLKIGFNPHFLLDALHAIDDDTATLYLSGRTSPCILKDDGSYMYLVLPVNFVE